MNSNLSEKDKNFVRELVNQGISWDDLLPKLAFYAIEELSNSKNDCAICKPIFYANLIKEARKYY